MYNAWEVCTNNHHHNEARLLRAILSNHHDTLPFLSFVIMMRLCWGFGKGSHTLYIIHFQLFSFSFQAVLIRLITIQIETKECFGLERVSNKINVFTTTFLTRYTQWTSKIYFITLFPSYEFFWKTKSIITSLREMKSNQCNGPIKSNFEKSFGKPRNWINSIFTLQHKIKHQGGFF